MVAFHFPPYTGSSGVQRTLRFVQHLPAHGWRPIVLSAHPRAYPQTSSDLLASIPSEVIVRRAFGLDASRHLSVAGRYPAALARPDRWATWRYSAVLSGLQLIRRHRPRAIWTTAPIPTAHAIGLALHRLTGLPWIADFRDPMIDEQISMDARSRQALLRLEARILRHARFSVFCAPAAAALYTARYPRTPSDRIAVIENGFDEESFAARAAGPISRPTRAEAVTLLHSGFVYPVERDPTHLFAAMASLRRRAVPVVVRVRFRASGNEVLLRALAERQGVSDLVELLPPVSYRAALEEMLEAQGLLLLQGAEVNDAIPAKLYEYLRAYRPILGLTAEGGYTAGTLRAAGIDSIAPLHDSNRIEQVLDRFAGDLVAGRAAAADPAFVNSCSRAMRAKDLAALLDRLQGDEPGDP
jgi:glycosyltransferase involved in cell wall biosynthesis